MFPFADGHVLFINNTRLNFNLLLSSYLRISEVHSIWDYLVRLIESIVLSLASSMYKDSSKPKLLHLIMSFALQ